MELFPKPSVRDLRGYATCQWEQVLTFLWQRGECSLGQRAAQFRLQEGGALVLMLPNEFLKFEMERGEVKFGLFLRFEEV